jgi:exonuclease VII large subunit
MLENSTTSSLEKLYKDVNSILKNNLAMFSGLTLTDISIAKPLRVHEQYNASFYTGTTKNTNKNYNVNLSISNDIVSVFNKENSYTDDGAKRYDIKIKSLAISSFGAITIIVMDIKETGVSDTELLRRRLKKYCNDKNYLPREKYPLPHLVTSILAITSKHSTIKDDIFSNLKLKKPNIEIRNCSSSEEIAKVLVNIDSDKFDVVVLYRGGHEDLAMNMFSDEKIIDAIVDLEIPLCVALGHEIDRPFVYALADLEFSTPSSFGTGIARHNSETVANYMNLLNTIGYDIRVIAKRAVEGNLELIGNVENSVKKIEANIKHRDEVKKVHVENKKEKSVLYLIVTILIGTLGYFLLK